MVLNIAHKTPAFPGSSNQDNASSSGFSVFFRGFERVIGIYQRGRMHTSSEGSILERVWSIVKFFYHFMLFVVFGRLFRFDGYVLSVREPIVEMTHILLITW